MTYMAIDPLASIIINKMTNQSDTDISNQIRGELSIVQNDAKLLTEMLAALGDNDDVSRNEIILELAGTLVEMQERMMDLLDVLLNEDVCGQ